MDWRKVMLGLILVLAVGSGYIVLNNESRWPFEFKRGLDIQGGMHLVLQAKTTDKVKEITPQVMSAAMAVVRNRVDGLGVAEPLIQPKGRDQLIVDMPGIKDKDEALRILGKTAVLTFRAHKADYPQGAPAPPMDTPIPVILGSATPATTAPATTPAPAASAAPAGTTVPATTKPAGGQAAGAAQGQGGQPTATPGAAATAAATPATAATTAATTAPATPAATAAATTAPAATPRAVITPGVTITAMPTMPVRRAPVDDWVLTGLTGTHITSARVEPQGSSWSVTAEFNSEGAKILAESSQVLLHKPMAIFLDNKLVSAPVVQSELNTGNVNITGNFDVKEANELMIVLKAGSLPVPLEVVENRSVDASLGAESVRASVFAGLIGGLLIMIFMFGYYRVPGLIANAALIIYSFLVLAIFKLIPVTLTVPGIAGFILSMGMAVDANILIFERTKEELKAGRTIYAAIEIGFKRAFSAILDSNVTTLLSCTVLFYFGTGLVKGFALTLAIGVIVSMFTAISASRNLLHWILEARGFKSPTLFGVQVPSKIR